MLKRLCIGCKYYNIKNSKCTKFSNQNCLMDAGQVRNDICGIANPIYYIPIKEKLKKCGFYEHLKNSDNFTEYKFNAGLFVLIKLNMISLIANPSLYSNHPVQMLIMMSFPIVTLRLYSLTNEIFKDIGKTQERINTIEEYEYEQFKQFAQFAQNDQFKQSNTSDNKLEQIGTN